MAMTASSAGKEPIHVGLPEKEEAMCLPLKATPPPSYSSQVRDKIELMDNERLLFDFLLQVTRHSDLDTTIRIAGGWVRDKFLDRQRASDRIEVVVDNMNGRKFCEKVNLLLSFRGVGVQEITVIRNKSKSFRSSSLERARMLLFDMRVDFVELRSKHYIMRSGLSLPAGGKYVLDASLRDFTINSLFYNVNTNSVEDFTGKGMRDLKSGKIMTPLNPKATFYHDPVRVFRAIRLATSLGFELDEELRAAAIDSDVKAAINHVLWRPSIGHEVYLMFSSAKDNQHVEALRMICDMGLFWEVFNMDPSDFGMAPTPGVVCVAYMEDAWRLMQRVGLSTFKTLEEKRLALYAALLLPLCDGRFTGEAVNRRFTGQAVIRFLFQKSLRRKSSESEKVGKLNWYAPKFSALFPRFLASADLKPPPADYSCDGGDLRTSSSLRVKSGEILREIGDPWRVLLLLSTLLYQSTDEATAATCSLEERRLNIFHKVKGLIENMCLENIWKEKPLLNGTDLMDMFYVVRGPLIGQIKREVLQFQLAHPSATAEDCRNWMEKEYPPFLKKRSSS
ncbi:tRNA nucleotidyltransferase cca2-like [Rhododendron vialii]|uniref:tRNA nucleotidyltransferase cca2-like n=1 Tax=Rhododendron vialii TaxID=182163 RepID=UPI00265EF6C2|nr:tRNA nucleotidyltransferase cca2-like [Rhododendron vialii]XP_058220797.1 tRNA nucleotidyltransferase cca2-like [Rhododendron vialii]XP_058220798.1 tRNA nucleotidyltransferase cca2-like [Rhododendron vialii]